jgi:hypothetical protein
MSEQWEYQVRIVLQDDFAEIARRNPGNVAMKALTDILKKHDAAIKCQFDAFAGYVAEAESHGIENYPLYEWTRATIQDPVKQAKYTKSFTLYVGGDEVYAGDKADALAADLQPLVGGGIVARMTRHDTNPANNPQPPAQYRK